MSVLEKEKINIDCEVGRFTKNLIDEAFGVGIDEAPCFRNHETKTNYFHLSNAQCGDGTGAKCHQVKRLKNNPVWEAKPGAERQWGIFEFGERMFLVFRTLNDDGSTDQYDKIIPPTLKTSFREAGKDYGIYYSQPVMKVVINDRFPLKVI